MIRFFALAAGVALAACGAAAGEGGVTEYPLPRNDSLPHRIVLGSDGNMWFTEQTGQKIGRITAKGEITEFAPPKAGNLYGIAAGPDHALWFTQPQGDRIGRIDTAGTITMFDLHAGTSPGEIVAGTDGALWFAVNGAKIGRIETSGAFAEFALPGGSGDVNNMVSDEKYLWFTLGFPSESIGRMDLRTHHIETFSLPDGSSMPQGIALARDGSVWVALPNAQQVARRDPSGKIAVFAMPDGGGDPGHPSQLVLGPDGNMWFSEFNNARIGRIDAAGKVAEFGRGITAYSSPDGIAFAPDGSLWFAEYNGSRIGKLPPQH